MLAQIQLYNFILSIINYLFTFKKLFNNNLIKITRYILLLMIKNFNNIFTILSNMLGFLVCLTNTISNNAPYKDRALN